MVEIASSCFNRKDYSDELAARWQKIFTPNSGIKSKSVMIRFTEEQNAYIEEMAKKLNLTKSHLIREGSIYAMMLIDYEKTPVLKKG